MNNPTTDNTLNILLFLCNWGAHAAFLTLQDKRRPIPHEIRMVRTPCTGRIDRAMMLKAFAKGADGVALVGCEPGTCRGRPNLPSLALSSFGCDVPYFRSLEHNIVIGVEHAILLHTRFCLLCFCFVANPS